MIAMYYAFDFIVEEDELRHVQSLLVNTASPGLGEKLIQMKRIQLNKHNKTGVSTFSYLFLFSYCEL